MKRNTINKTYIFIVISFGILICKKADSQIDSTKSNYDKKIDYLNKVPVGLYFNRIEGYTPFIYEDLVFNHLHDLNVKVNLNYATNNNDLTYSLNVNYPFFKGKVKIGGSYFKNNVSNESWTASRLENTLAGILSKRDYWDYYSVEGYNFLLQCPINKKISFGVKLKWFKYNDLGDSIGFAQSLFRSKHTYRGNPSIFEALQNAIEFNFTLNQLINSPFFGQSGWYSKIIYRRESGDIKNNYLNISSALYIPARGNDKIYLSGNLIMNDGDYKQQYLFGLGGNRVMKAIDPYIDRGQNLGYLNLEYQFSKRQPRDKRKSTIQTIIFSEFGKIWDSTKPEDAAVDVKHIGLLTDIGIGVILDNHMRFNLARELGNAGNWRLSVNILLPSNFASLNRD